jgi:hypothetical protein
MAKKGKKKLKRQARQAEIDRQRASRREEWESLWSKIQDGSGAQDEMKALTRPPDKCSECDLFFLANDAFHYSVIGPIHGWGEFEKTNTCRWLKQRKEDNIGGKSGWNRCLECSEIVIGSDPSHTVKGGKIHGNGSWKDHGTCLIRHRQDLAKKLGTVSEEFFEGNLSADEVLVIIEDTIEEETQMATYLESVDTTYKPDNKKSESAEKMEPASTLVYTSEDQATQEFEVIRPAQAQEA